MCLLHSVGRKGFNAHDDVKVVQVLLNMNISRLIPMAPLVADGGIGKNTYTAIEEFQRRVLGKATPDGRIDPGGGSLKQLQAGIPRLFNEDTLQGVMIRAKGETVTAFLTPLIQTMAANCIDSPLRMRPDNMPSGVTRSR